VGNLKILARSEANQGTLIGQGHKNHHCTPYKIDAQPSIFSDAG